MRFRREEIDSFHATDYDFDPRTGTVLLRYAFSGSDDGAGAGGITFEERIELGGEVRLTPEQATALDRVLSLLHAAAGTSYFKAAAPNVVSIDSGPLTPPELRLVGDLYDKGLREFAYKNDLPVPVEVEVRAEVVEAVESGEVIGVPGGGVGGSAPPAGIAIPVGGGKDSLVVVEAMRDSKPLLLAVNPAPAAFRTAEAAGLELVSVRRTLDPALAELNKQGALNGHVPITAVISLILVAAGYVHGYSTTLMALEGSADEPTRTSGATDINHQWSKSSEFESQLVDVLAQISPGIHYGSVLRSLSELEIAGCFAGLPQYHSGFRSCNRAFSQTDPLDGWCDDCAKCRFVYLMLSTSLGREEMVGIFGRDLLGEPEQVDGFRDLLELDRKPFECVGTRSESIAALNDLAASGTWAGSVVVESLMPIVRAPGFAAAELAAAELSARRSPEDVLEVVRDAADRVAGTVRSA